MAWKGGGKLDKNKVFIVKVFMIERETKSTFRFFQLKFFHPF